MMPTMAPSAISAVMRNVLLSSNSILSTPEPTAEITSLDAQAIEFELAFRVRDFASASAAKAVIGHLKSDGHLNRCFLKRRHGDAANIVLSE
jgi:hypothetical protein